MNFLNELNAEKKQNYDKEAGFFGARASTQIDNDNDTGSNEGTAIPWLSKA